MIKSVMYSMYRDEVVPKLIEKRNYGNRLQVPRLEKIVINSGISTAKDRAVLEEAQATLSAVSGQKAVITKARRSISNFKLREGMPVGVCVTLRRGAMFNFLYRLINVVLPRVRDFRGVSAKAFDGDGNYSLGLNDQSVFPEIDLDKVKNTIGMNITIVTTAAGDDEARELLALLGMPFAN